MTFLWTTYCLISSFLLSDDNKDDINVTPGTPGYLPPVCFFFICFQIKSWHQIMWGCVYHRADPDKQSVKNSSWLTEKGALSHCQLLNQSDQQVLSKCLLKAWNLIRVKCDTCAYDWPCLWIVACHSSFWRWPQVTNVRAWAVLFPVLTPIV